MSILQVYRAADGSPRLRVRYGVMHAKHNVVIAGKAFRGGEFIPSNVAARATPQQRAMMEDRHNPAANQKAVKVPLKAKRRDKSLRPGVMLNPPRKSPGAARGVAAVSPETGPAMGIGEALAKSTGPGQRNFVAVCEDIDRRLGLMTNVVSAVGSWAPEGQAVGAEPTTVTSYHSARDYDEIRYSAACKGYAGNQLASLAFGVDKDGPDTLWSMHVAGELSGIRDALAKHGLEYHTLREGTGGHGKVEVMILDKGTALGDKVKAAADHFGVETPSYRSGHGEFLGDDSGDRRQARKAYRREMRAYEKKHPDRRTWP